ncbi:hypothetical protein V9K67_25870 [Paraflavisolibacter sp. H34]
MQGRFAPVFWSPVHFPNQPGTMGLLFHRMHLRSLISGKQTGLSLRQ